MLKKVFRLKPRPDDWQSAAAAAGELFDQGQKCAKSVLLATTGSDDPGILAACDAFSGGIGGRQCLCGAIAGGVLALSLRGREKFAGELVDRFKARHKLTCCKGLSAPYAWSSREHLANCRRLTVATAEDVAVLLER